MFHDIANHDQPSIVHESKGIHVYILNKKRQRIGVFAATTNDIFPDKIWIGWSLCKLTSGDTFNSKIGAKIAYDRSSKCSIAPVPTSLVARYAAFKHRCEIYFKDKTVIC